MNHGCPKVDANPEFQYHRGIVIIFIIIILSENFPEEGLFFMTASICWIRRLFNNL